MSRSDALILREHLLSLKVWVEHWQTDRSCNLVPTQGSLDLAKTHADCALNILERIAEQKEAA
jgi:hypothetical protein